MIKKWIGTVGLAVLGASSVLAQSGWPELSGLLDQCQGTWNGNPTINEASGALYAEGALLGNGDMGVAVEADSTQQTHYLSVSEFMARSCGKVIIKRASGTGNGGSPSCVQDLKEAHVDAHLVLSNTPFVTKSWVPYISQHENLLVIELSHNETGTVPVEVRLEQLSSTSSPSTAGNDSRKIWTTRRRHDVNNPPPGWGPFSAHLAVATRIFGAIPTSTGNNGSNEAWLQFDLPANKTVTIVTSVKTSAGLADQNPPLMDTVAELLAAVQARADSIIQQEINAFETEHVAWWKQFWLKSYVNFSDNLLNKYYYGALYALACSSRPGFVCPGINGIWTVNDIPMYGNEYYMNYNIQAPFYGVFSSNRPELIDSYNDIFFSFYNHRRWATNWDCGYPGFHMGRHEPIGLHGGAHFDQRSWEWLLDNYYSDFTINSSPAVPNKKNDQLSIAPFMAVNMINGYLFTEDIDYITRTIEPLPYSLYDILVQMAEFFENYMIPPDQSPSGFWEIHESNAREGPYKADGTANDDNALIDLAFIRNLMKALVKISTDLGVDENKRALWQDIHDRMMPYPTIVLNGKTCFRECWNRDELSYNPSSGVVDALKNMAHPCSEVHQGSDAAEYVRNAIVEADLQANGDAWRGGDNNNFCNVYPALVRAFWDADDLYNTFLGHLSPSTSAWTLRNNLTVYQQGGGLETSGTIDMVNDMVMMSHLGFIQFFPVWPTSKDAKFVRLRARGAFLVDGEFNNGQIVSASIFSERGKDCKVVNPWPGQQLMVTRDAGSKLELIDCSTEIIVDHNRTVTNEYCTFQTYPGETYTLTTSASINNTAPYVTLMATPRKGPAPLIVDLSVSARDADQDVLSYSWDLDGDGTVDVSNVTQTQTTVSHLGENEIAVWVDDGTTVTKQIVRVLVDLTENADLVAWWKLDERLGTEAEDSSGNQLHATISGAMLKQEGIIGYAMDFDGVDDYLYADQQDTKLDFSGKQLTFCAWIKPDTVPGNSWSGVFGAEQGGLALGLKNGELMFTQVNMVDASGSGVQVQAGQWTHVACTFDEMAAANNLKYYVNGELVQTRSFDINLAASKPTYLVGERAPSLNFFDGLIDDARMYRRILSASELSDLGATPPPLGGTVPDVWYKLDESAGATVTVDASGNNRDAAISGATVGQPGQIGSAYSFNGTTDYLRADPASLTASSTLTMTAWIYPNSYDAFDGIFGADGGGLALGFKNGNLMLGQVNTSDGPNFPQAIPLNQWTHVACSIDANETSNNLKYYVNGVLVRTASYTLNTGSLTSKPTYYVGLKIGGYGYFDGLMDDLRIYYRVLADSEIAEIKDGGGGGQLDPAKDSDGDGLNDFLEGAFGFHPMVIDAPEVSDYLTVDASGNVQYTVYNVVNGYTHELQYTSDLSSGSWASHTTLNGVDGGNPTVETLPAGLASNDRLFLRVRVTK